MPGGYVDEGSEAAGRRGGAVAAAAAAGRSPRAAAAPDAGWPSGGPAAPSARLGATAFRDGDCGGPGATQAGRERRRSAHGAGAAARRLRTAAGPDPGRPAAEDRRGKGRHQGGQDHEAERASGELKGA